MEFKETIIKYHIQAAIEAIVLGGESKEEIFAIAVQRFKANAFNKDTPPEFLEEALQYVEKSTPWLIQSILMLYDKQFQQISIIQDDIVDQHYTHLLKSVEQQEKDSEA